MMNKHRKKRNFPFPLYSVIWKLFDSISNKRKAKARHSPVIPQISGLNHALVPISASWFKSHW